MFTLVRAEVLPLRSASRELVRELGFLEQRETVSGLSHSYVHALIEIGAAGALAQGELSGILHLDKSQTSRIVKELEMRGLLAAESHPSDLRVRILSLTSKGRAKLGKVHDASNARVDEALALLGSGERQAVLRGMELYARALGRARRAAAYEIRAVAARDRAGVARLIRTVMPEFGARGPGFAINDTEVDDMFRAYNRARAGYFVIVQDDRVLGGGGWAPLEGGGASTCELRKMYFMPELRGLGLGQRVLSMCIEGAKRDGFHAMYLETLTSMQQAQALYRRNGFRMLDGPMGKTGHFSCDTFYARDLTTPSDSGT